MRNLLPFLLLPLFSSIASPAADAGAPCEPLWVPGSAIPGLTGVEVNEALSFDDGSGPALYLGGSFAEAGGLAVQALVRWDGSGFHSIGNVSTGTTPGTVRALAVFNGELIAAGSFGRAGATTVSNIARWDGAEWYPLGSGLNGGVYDLIVHGGRLIATGGFSVAGGVPALRIAAWDGTGWAPLGGGLGSGGSGTGFCLTAFEGDLVVGGNFSRADSDTVENIARWDGVEWHPLGSGLPAGSVRALASFDMDGAGPDPARLVAGGAFTPTTPFDKLAFWDGSSWNEFGNGTQNTVHALLPLGEDLYVGGFFTGVGGSTTNAARVARWNVVGGWSVVGAGFDAPIGGRRVLGLAIHEGALVAVGDFGSSGGVAMHRAARLEAGVWRSLSPGIGGLYGAGVHDLLPWGDGVVVAGRFASVDDGIVAHNVAHWSPTAGWSAMGAGLGDNTYTGTHGLQWVEALALHDGEIHAAWINYNGSGSAGPRISRWDGSAWQQIVSIVAATNQFQALHSHAGDLYVGGSFTTIGIPAARVARYDGSQWHALGTGVNTGEVRAMTTFEGDLLVAGTLTQAGGAPAFRIARWNGSSWSDMGAGLLGSTAAASVFAYYGGALHVGTGTGLYRWDGTAWTRLVASGEILDLQESGGELYMTGSFNTVDGAMADMIARWDGANSHPVGDGLSGDGMFATPVRGEALAPLPDGTLMVGSNETTRAGQIISYALSRLLTCGTTGLNDRAGDVPAEYELRLHATSRPGGRTTLEFMLPERGRVAVTVCDVMGRRVAGWSADALAGGAHAIPLEAIWGDGQQLPAAGIYQVALAATCGPRRLRANTRVVQLR